MNSNSHNNNSNNNNPQPWMMSSEHGPEPFNYMVPRPPAGSVLQPQSQHINPPNHNKQSEEELSVSPPAQALDYNHPRFHNKSGGNRVVIPSKRAAQNRAAQKAFRQRREQYIKDLEIKAKEMEDWQDEMDKLRKENCELRERVAALENRVSILTGGDPSKMPESTLPKKPTSAVIESSSSPQQQQDRSVSLTITATTARNNEEEVICASPTPVIITLPNTAKQAGLRHEGSNNLLSAQPQLPLRAPNQTGVETTPYHPNDHAAATLIGNDTTNNNKRRKLDDPLSQQSQHIGQVPNTSPSQQSLSSMIHNNNNNNNTHHHHKSPPPPPPPSNNPLLLPIQHATNDFWTNNNNNTMQTTTGGNTAVGDFDFDFDFDPFFEDEFGPTITNNNDFLPNANSGQVLDDLFAMLQTRQRPQIPIVTIDDNLDFNNSGGGGGGGGNIMQ